MIWIKSIFTLMLTLRACMYIYLIIHTYIHTYIYIYIYIYIYMEVSSSENHWTKWSIFQHAMFDYPKVDGGMWGRSVPTSCQHSIEMQVVPSSTRLCASVRTSVPGFLRVPGPAQPEGPPQLPSVVFLFDDPFTVYVIILHDWNPCEAASGPPATQQGKLWNSFAIGGFKREHHWPKWA